MSWLLQPLRTLGTSLNKSISHHSRERDRFPYYTLAHHTSRFPRARDVPRAAESPTALLRRQALLRSHARLLTVVVARSLWIWHFSVALSHGARRVESLPTAAKNGVSTPSSSRQPAIWCFLALYLVSLRLRRVCVWSRRNCARVNGCRRSGGLRARLARSLARGRRPRHMQLGTPSADNLERERKNGIRRRDHRSRSRGVGKSENGVGRRRGSAVKFMRI